MSVTLSASKSANSQAIAEWVKLFPRQVTETYTSSVTFMKQLTTIAVSTITYLKSIFPEESFTIENFVDMELKILKKKCRDELAQFVSTALMQAFEAFDKKYLHQLALCFYDGKCHVDNLAEYHVFEFKYNSDGVTMDLHSNRRGNFKHSSRYAFDQIREQTANLIRVIANESCDNELPSSYDVSLRLYYNSDAPAEYQAPGFLPASAAEDHLAPTRGLATEIGCVETPFHRLGARFHRRDNAPISHEANASQNAPMLTQNEEFCSGINSELASESGAPRLRCPCNQHCVEDDETLVLLTCHYCNTTQHATCFGVLRGAVAQILWHCCTSCSDEDSTRTPTDFNLALLPAQRRECLCIFRHALVWCGRGGVDAIDARSLVEKFALSLASASKLMKLLRSHAVIEKGEDKDMISRRKINAEGLNLAMTKFFISEDTNMVDRLLAETLSQGRQPDPVGDVLGPMEKVDLQNATAMGQIIEHALPDSVVEDSTLKQYREALLSSDQRMDEDLPLSGSHNPVKDMEKIGKQTTKRKMDSPETRQLRSGMKNKKAKVLPKDAIRPIRK